MLLDSTLCTSIFRRYSAVSLLLLVSYFCAGCGTTTPTMIGVPKSDPLPTTTLHIGRIVSKHGSVFTSVSGTIINPQSMHLAAKQEFTYKPDKVYLRVLDRKGGGAELYTLDAKPVSWAVLTDAPDHPSFTAVQHNVFEIDAATFAGTDRLIFYPDGKDISAVPMSGSVLFRLLERGYLRIERPGSLFSSQINTIPVHGISKVTFNRAVHVSDINIESSSLATENSRIDLPMGGADLRLQFDTLEALLRNQANVRCEAHYSSSIAQCYAGPVLLLVVSVALYLAGIRKNEKKSSGGCWTIFYSVVLTLFALGWGFMSLLYVGSDLLLSNFVHP